jgi:peptidoglycan/xylan/chitin deacetylase (PgdA/CDA1 family)
VVRRVLPDLPGRRPGRSYVPRVDRRRFLTVIAAGLTAAAASRIDAVPLTGDAPPLAGRPAEVTPEPVLAVAPDLPEPQRAPLGEVTVLPGTGRLLALSIDDGTSTEVVAGLTQFAADTGVRLTFFPNGRYASWTDNAPALRPLVDSGQIALGNHTWSHPDLTTLSDAEVAEEITRNRDFLRDVFGVEDTPFLRPPFGSHDERTDRISADLGHPTIAMWNGTFDDARPITGADLVAAARKWFTEQAIIVGHANQPAITTVYDELLAVIEERRLTPVTLADVWTPAAAAR